MAEEGSANERGGAERIVEGRSILTANFLKFIHELSFGSARGTGCRLRQMRAKIRGIVIGNVKRGTATGKRMVLGGVLFARDGIEEPEDSTRIRTEVQIRTGGLPGCGFGSRDD